MTAKKTTTKKTATKTAAKTSKKANSQKPSPKTEKKEEKPKEKKNKFARLIKWIGVHCSAGTGDLASAQGFWEEILGWENPGYHFWIDYDGTITQLLPIEKISNGVLGFNENLINIAYRGGVIKKYRNRRPYFVGADTRTKEQKDAIIECIQKVFVELNEKGHPIDDIEIKGHYEFSPDQNGNGVIEPWERIKECPSYPAGQEYKDLML